MKRLTLWKNGSWLALLIVFLGLVCAASTVWTYSQHVYSSHDAQLLNREGVVGAFYPIRFAKRIFPHQVARITFQNQAFTLPCQAEVISVTPTTLGRRQILLVMLQVLNTSGERAQPMQKGALDVNPGATCAVTIDTTIPLIQ